MVLFTLFTMFLFVHHPVLANINHIASLENLDDFYTDLNGEWYFVPESFVTLEEVGEGVGMKVDLPSSFITQIGKTNSYGTYYKKLTLPNTFIGKTLAIHVPYQYSAYTLMVDDLEIATNGTVGHDSHSHRAEMAPRTGYFIPVNNEIEILMHVSSFDHIRGGPMNSMYIGEAQLVTKEFMTKINFDFFLISALIIMGIFTLSFVSFRPQEKEFMIFGIFCFSIAMRALFAYPFYYTVIFPNISWIWGTRLEYILSILCSGIFVILLKSWYSESFSRKVVLLLMGILLPTAIITLFTQPVYFQNLFFKIAVISIPTGSYFVYLTYKEIKVDNSRAKINAVGLILVFLAFFNDFAQGVGLYQFQPLVLAATAIYVLLHVIQMSIEYAKLNKSLEVLNKELVDLNTSLDKEVYQRTLELEKANKLLEKQAMLDGLTGIANRRSFNLFLKQAFIRAIETEQALSLLMLDVDEFKKYNDHFGHLKGDWLLQELTNTVQAQLSEGDFLARYGGEELSIVLPETRAEEAYEIAEKVRQAVEGKKYPHPEGKTKIVTCSIGVATLTTAMAYKTEDMLVNAADIRLYKAKQAGRNKVI